MAVARTAKAARPPPATRTVFPFSSELLELTSIFGSMAQTLDLPSWSTDTPRSTVGSPGMSSEAMRATVRLEVTPNGAANGEEEIGEPCDYPQTTHTRRINEQTPTCESMYRREGGKEESSKEGEARHDAASGLKKKSVCGAIMLAMGPMVVTRWARWDQPRCKRTLIVEAYVFPFAGKRHFVGYDDL